jgi:L-threonylcarbamoyladenylate synthase
MRVLTSIDEAAALLDEGGVVAIPTDTVYGVAASLAHPAAVASLFVAKGRRSDVPLPVLVASTEQLEELLGRLDEPTRSLGSLWPGALTIVVDCDEELGRLVGSTGTVGVRCPDDVVLRSLLERTGPLAVTSANRSGEPPATSPAEVVAFLGHSTVVTAVLDGGVRDGLPSTVVSMVAGRPEVLREGPISRATLDAAISEG